ncbi:uncharacterized protein LOC127788963 [Diospyros lotus]|uniref:uncharacterized protein LOC127788963 n=1 Tax=Diospyros lotus TaxID=55363 RepID=UPI00225B2D98|nr:uncharacterized protein LOC127788963 [Diospyros lotus]
MALRATISRAGSSNAAPAERRRRRPRILELGRRSLLLSSTAAAASLQSNNNESGRTELLKRYLKKSEENKAKNDKERLDSYYKRNYKDYFDFVEGSLKGKKEPLTESEKGILDWLRSNK